MCPMTNISDYHCCLSVMGAMTNIVNGQSWETSFSCTGACTQIQNTRKFIYKHVHVCIQIQYVHGRQIWHSSMPSTQWAYCSMTDCLLFCSYHFKYMRFVITDMAHDNLHGCTCKNFYKTDCIVTIRISAAGECYALLFFVICCTILVES